MTWFATLTLAVASIIACCVQNAVAMSGELRIYKEPEFKRLRRLITVFVGDVCYDMSCPQLNDITSSARWSGLPVTGPAFTESQAKIAFYAGGNCTGKAAVVSTRVGQIPNFAAFGMDNAISSFAVLGTSTAMLHKSSDVCAW
ncbi:unnamed protein product [Phytophthora fragariaefolia]|uniref:Unnamed protein product n=1 Tax=Phytophthora fragariaefolia TaxID=1490495 RepID=A0A9W6YL43_9STRA|nr:unnamed protein product [Phytophthora fragariaefolia]